MTTLNEITINMLADHYYNMYNKEKSEHELHSCWSTVLPIKSIDGIRVDVRMQMYKKDVRTNEAYKTPDQAINYMVAEGEHITIDIESDKLRQYGEPETYYHRDIYNKKFNRGLPKAEVYTNIDNLDLTREDWNAIIPRIDELFKKIRFDKLHGKFTEEPAKSNELQDALLALISSEKIELKDEKCAVCYEWTRCKTRCNHAVCYHCLEQIKTKKVSEDPNEEEDMLECPICRQNCIELDEEYYQHQMCGEDD